MKKIAVWMLVLALLVPLIPTKAETVSVKPYYGLGSSDFNRVKFPNLEGRLKINVVLQNEEVYLSANGSSDVNKIVSTTKSALDRYPEGMRSFVLFNTSGVFELREDAIYFDKGVDKLKAAFTGFIKPYAELGGKLDYIVLDLEYVDVYAWYLYSKVYTKDNPNIYNDIVENPLYQTEIRPMLVERGFLFYEEDPSMPEIWSIYPRLKGAEAEKYAVCQTIWNTVMRIRLNNYLTEAVYEPLMQYMPDVRVYDYQSRDTYAWLKDLTDKGEHNYVAGNSVAVGATSHHNTYGSRLSDAFFEENGQPVYNTPVAYNGAEFAATPFNRILWDVNLMKNMYAASDTKMISVTVAEYDYSPNKVGTPSNTPFYTESLFHMGLLDPKPFNIYMYDKAFESTAEYNKRAQVLQEIMVELTRVAGYADRKPIAVPATWNSSFLLSGIYANGRNVWRLTPDTDKVSLADFKVAGSDPTFSVNGQTITFPGGKIIADGTVSVVGTCGYWIETASNVVPIVTNDADRYSKYPSFAEDFEGYTASTAFDAKTAKPANCWTVTGTMPTVQSVNNNKMLSLTGTATVANTNLPQNITAGDSYAKQQVWEISFTLPENFSGALKLLSGNDDAGIKIAGNKLYYSESGGYKELTGVTLSAGQKYTVKRTLDFRNGFLSDFALLDSAGKVLGQVKAVPMIAVSLPVTKISFACENVTGQILLDDYKLYPTGVAADFEVYNANSGILLADTATKNTTDVAYRLSWLNGSDKLTTGAVVATFYDVAGKELSRQEIAQVSMKPGWDGVETGIVKVPQGQAVVLEMDVAKDESPQPTQPTTQPTTAPTTAPTTQPTTQPTMASTAPATDAPTTAATDAPTTATTDAPTTATTDAPTTDTSSEPVVPVGDKSESAWVLPVVIVAVLAAGTVTIAFSKKRRQ